MDFTSFIIFFQWSLSVIKVFARRLLGANIVRPRKKERNFSFIILFCEEKYQKSFKRIFHPLKNLLPRARVSRTSHAWQVRAARGRERTCNLAALRNLDYTTRANISHETAEQIRARIACTPAESARRA